MSIFPFILLYTEEYFQFKCQLSYFDIFPSHLLLIKLAFPFQADSLERRGPLHSLSCLGPEYLSGQPFPSPGNLPNSGIKLWSSTLQANVLPSEPPEKSYSMLCGDLNGKEIQKRGDICIHTADSLCCTAETNTMLSSNYTPKKIHQEKRT